jgi:hypothetical protein
MNNLDEIKPIIIKPLSFLRIYFIISLISFLFPLFMFIFLFLRSLIDILFEPPGNNLQLILPFIVFLVILVFFSILLLFSYGHFFHTFIRIDKDNLVYKNLFYIIEADWENIIDEGSFYGNECLILSESRSKSINRPLSWFIEVTGISKRIPINHFTQDWRSSELGKIIIKNALYLKITLRERNNN